MSVFGVMIFSCNFLTFRYILKIMVQRPRLTFNDKKVMRLCVCNCFEDVKWLRALCDNIGYMDTFLVITTTDM
jgi:hypothetical protein